MPQTTTIQDCTIYITYTAPTDTAPVFCKCQEPTNSRKKKEFQNSRQKKKNVFHITQFQSQPLLLINKNQKLKHENLAA